MGLLASSLRRLPLIAGCCAAFLTTVVVVEEAQPIRFSLCRGFVRSTTVVTDEAGKTSVYVQLSDAGAQALATFTRDHLGAKVQVVANGITVVEPTVKTVVESGKVLSAPRSREAAQSLIEQLNDLPAEPCGMPNKAAAGDGHRGAVQ